MEQKKLMQELRNGVLHNVYLLYGTEKFLVAGYMDTIEKTVVAGQANAAEVKNTFDDTASVHEIISAADSLPFFCERRLVIVKNSKLFLGGRKVDSDMMATYVQDVASTTTIVFVEEEVDRRGKLFKQIDKAGTAIDCKPLSPIEINKWIARRMQKNNVTANAATISQLIRTVGTDMYMLDNEISKLAAYCGYASEINPNDISAICTQTFDSRIFDLLKFMFSGRVQQSLNVYNNMLRMKEQPIVVLSMIIRQFRMMLIAKCAKENGLTIAQTAMAYNFRDFMVAEALEQGRKFSINGLLDALQYCMQTDVQTKTGALAPELAVEMLIIKYCALQK